jgi:hypothetical protein
MGSNFSIFGTTSTSSSSCETSSRNCQTTGILKYKFETKSNKSSRAGIPSYSPRGGIGEHPQGLKLTSKELQVENQHVQGKTLRQLELVKAPSMPDEYKFSQKKSNNSVKQGSYEDKENQEIEHAYLATQTEIDKTQESACQISASESRSSALHQLKRMRASPSHKTFSGNAIKDSEVANAEAQRMEASRNSRSNEPNIIFDQLLNPRGGERIKFGCSEDQDGYLQQTLDASSMFYPLYHEYRGLASLQNTAPCYDMAPKCTAESNFQCATRSKQNECVPLEMLTMNQYVQPYGLPNESHISFPQTDSAVVAPSVSYLSLPAVKADVPNPVESHLIQARGKNSSKRSSAKQLVDGVLNAVGRSGSKWKGDEKQVTPAAESALPIVPSTRNYDKGEYRKSGPLVKRSIKGRAAHQARLASSPSGKEFVTDPTSEPKIASSLYTSNPLLSNADSAGIVKIIHGYKVTMADEENKVFIIDLVSPETCKLIRRLADDHCARAEASGNPAASWRTLYTYSKMDLPCCEVKDLTNIANNIMAKVILIVGEIFGNHDGVSKLRPRSWKEPHLLKYQAIDGFPHHTGICEHYDGKRLTTRIIEVWPAYLCFITFRKTQF